MINNNLKNERFYATWGEQQWVYLQQCQTLQRQTMSNQFPASRSPQQPLRVSTSFAVTELGSSGQMFPQKLLDAELWACLRSAVELAGAGKGLASSEAPPEKTETNLRLFTYPVLWVIWVSCSCTDAQLLRSPSKGSPTYHTWMPRYTTSIEISTSSHSSKQDGLSGETSHLYYSDNWGLCK